jgi:hypothetical protein
MSPLRPKLRRLDFVGVTEALGSFYARVAAACDLPPVSCLARKNDRDEV